MGLSDEDRETESVREHIVSELITKTKRKHWFETFWSVSKRKLSIEGLVFVSEQESLDLYWEKKPCLQLFMLFA